jgi:SAM-dependent methyltransferase
MGLLMSKTMGLATRKAKRVMKRIISTYHSAFLSYPQKVQCNICGWAGRHFLSDSWHEQIICPGCRAGIRQRLFFAALQNIDELSFERIIRGKQILHFAPEDVLSSRIQRKAAAYVTADFFRRDCDVQLDMSNMPQIKNECFDTVIAFDVLEHVPDYGMALDEIRRVLSPSGFAILTVPQKDNLRITYENRSIVTEEDRIRHFGQRDHLRLFGDDFPAIVESKGFAVSAIDESSFSADMKQRSVLFPPVLSPDPLATNYRKAFFCQKTS